MKLLLIQILFSLARWTTSRGWLIGQALHNKGMLLVLAESKRLKRQKQARLNIKSKLK